MNEPHVNPDLIEAGEDPTARAAVWWRLDDLTPNAENVKVHPKEQIVGLAALIMAHGFTTVITAHWPTMRIVKGHGRRLSLLEIWKADPAWTMTGAPEAGHVPVRFKGGTWEDAVRDAIADNRIAEDSTWDEALLASVVASFVQDDEDTVARVVRETALPTGQVNDLVRKARGRINPRSVGAPPVPVLPHKAQSQPGETYHLGPHILICGDCTKRETLVPALGGTEEHGFERHVDAVVTDPPYLMFGSSTGISADDKIGRTWAREVLMQAAVAAKPRAHIYVCCDWRTFPTWSVEARASALAMKNCLVWDKGGGGTGSQYMGSHELVVQVESTDQRQRRMTVPKGGWGAREFDMIAYLSNENAGGRPRIVRKSSILRHDASDSDDGPERVELVEEVEGEAGEPRQMLRYGRTTGTNRLHNAAKPIPLIMELIENATDPNQWVLDLFGGSGTTLIAAAKCDRQAILVEVDPYWCDVIRHRWTEFAKEAGVDPGPGAMTIAAGTDSLVFGAAPPAKRGKAKT